MFNHAHSLLSIHILTHTVIRRAITHTENAKLQRRRPPPSYADRVYDTTRAVPTAVERRLFPKLLAARGPGVREGARLAAYLIRTKGAGSGGLAWPLFVHM